MEGGFVMLTFKDPVDKLMFILFCILMLFLSIGNLMGVTYLCYRADHPVGTTDQEDFDFEPFLKEEIARQYEKVPGKIKKIEVEWSVRGNNSLYQGRIWKGERSMEFYGQLRKFNTGWKHWSFTKE
jgi:hypothetical protein